MDRHSGAGNAGDLVGGPMVAGRTWRLIHAGLGPGLQLQDRADRPGWQHQAIWAFLGLGVLLRITRYLLAFPLWGDECMVAVNFIDRSYGQLLEPLEHHQICPPLFLWVELAAVRMLGYSEYALRLFPTVCSLAGLVLFTRLARRLLEGSAVVWAVAIFAVSYYPIRHGAEVKPYAADLLVGVVVLTWGSAAVRQGQARWIWLLAAAAPVLLAMSLPAVFVLGGVGLVLAPLVWRSKSPRAFLALAAYLAALGAAFGAMYVFFLRPHHAAAVAGGIGQMWDSAFPPLRDPWRLPAWLVEMHTSHMFAYPLGGERGASALTATFFVIGAIAWWRGRRVELLLCLTPFALALVAATMRKYPYGESARTMQYVAPMICLLAGQGVQHVLAWLQALRSGTEDKQPNARWGGAACSAGIVALATIGAAGLCRDLVRPYKTRCDLRQREFARWFWTDFAATGELVCVNRDLKEDFSSAAGTATVSHENVAAPAGPVRRQFAARGDWRRYSAVYLTYQQLYSRRHQRNEPPRFEAARADRPLRCILHGGPVATARSAEFLTWLQRMQVRWELVNRYTLHVNPQGGPVYHDAYEVFEFVPRTAGPLWQSARSPEAGP
jgi:hypothetical protein